MAHDHVSPGPCERALSTTATELIAWRAVMGLGAALVMPATMALLTHVFTDPAERAKAIGIWSAVSGLGVAIGPTAGGWLLDHYAWGAIFAVNIPIVAVALIAGWFLVPASVAPRRPRFDPVGTLLAVFGLGALTFTLIDAGAAGWTSNTTLVRAAASIALLAGFALWEARTPNPMVELALFKDPRFTAASGAVTIVFFGLGGMTFVLTQIYQFVLGYSPLAAGVRSLPSALALTVAAGIGGKLATRYGVRATMTGGLVVTAAGLGLFGLATGGTTYTHYVIAASIVSAGIGLTMTPATQSMITSLPPAKVGVGSAIGNATRNLGVVLGVAAIGSIAATSYTHDMAGAGAAGHSIGAAAQVVDHLRAARPADAGRLHALAANAFVDGATLGLLIAAAIALAGALAAARILPKRA